MKNRIIKSLFAATICQLSACERDTGLPSYETAVTVIVATEDNKGVVNCNIEVVFDDAETTKNAIKYGATDKDGKATTSARSRPTISIRSQHQDFYPTYEQSIINLVDEKDIRYLPLKKLNHSITLRKIINPIPLYAKQNDIPIPEKEKWIGFDLEKADWVEPYGLGISSDVEFHLSTAPIHVNRDTLSEQKSLLERIYKEHSENPRLKAAYLEYRDEFYGLPEGTSTYDESIKFRLYSWQGIVKMRVPFKQGGIIAEKEKYLKYSKAPTTDYARFPVPEMRMPHHAPQGGYQKEYEWKKTSADQLTIDEKLGFFLKTRVKLDEQGKEISAHYAKFITDVQIDIRGRIKFTSYFNPTANDTNLEFDLKKNLFKNLKDLEKPFLP